MAFGLYNWGASFVWSTPSVSSFLVLAVLKFIWMQTSKNVQKICNKLSQITLTLSWRGSQSYSKQFSYLLCKLMDWFLYNRDLCHQRVNRKRTDCQNLMFFRVSSSASCDTRIASERHKFQFLSLSLAKKNKENRQSNNKACLSPLRNVYTVLIDPNEKRYFYHFWCNA